MSNVAKVGRSENAERRVNSIRGSLPWPAPQLHKSFAVEIDRVVQLERFIHENLPFERLCYRSGRKSEWYKIDDLEEFTTCVEILCNVSPHVEKIVERSLSQNSFLYRELPLLSADAMIGLMHQCQQADPRRRLWLYQVVCSNGCYKEGVLRCACDRMGNRFAAVLIETVDPNTFLDMGAPVDTR